MISLIETYLYLFHIYIIVTDFMPLLVKRLDTLMSKRKLKYSKSNLTKYALKNKLCEPVNPHKSRTKWMDCQCDNTLCERHSIKDTIFHAVPRFDNDLNKRACKKNI